MLEGVSDRTAAEALRGEAITVPRAVLGTLDEGEFLVDDLVGCEVVDGERPVGRVLDVLLLPSADTLEVERPGGEPLLVPLVGDAVRSVDTAGARIDVDIEFLEGRRVNIDIFTLFPEWFDWFLRQHHVRNALRLGHDLRLFNYRDTTPLSHGQVDDSPYGGGAGMVLRVDVVDAALQAVYGDAGPPRPPAGRVVVLAPSGRPFDDSVAEEYAGLESLTLLSARYEGIDERVRDQLADDAVSIGPYVLSGGEPAAMVVADAVAAQAPRRARRRAQRGRGIVQQRAGGRRRVPALHAPRLVSGLGGA